MSMPERRALLIGVLEYQESGLTSFPDVVKNDIAALEASLRGSGYTEIKIHGIDSPWQSTRTSIWNAIRKFIRRAGKGDTLLVYLSGHGLHFEGKDYFVPADAILDDPSEYATILVKIDFAEVVETSQAETVIFFVDACRQGVKLKFKTPYAVGWGTAERVKANRQCYLIVFACEQGQFAHYVSGKENFSIFTRALAEAIAIQNPATTVDEVIRAIEKRLLELSRQYDKEPQLIRKVHESSVDESVTLARVICDGAPALILPSRPGLHAVSSSVQTFSAKTAPEFATARDEVQYFLTADANRLRHQPIAFESYCRGGGDRRNMLAIAADYLAQTPAGRIPTFVTHFRADVGESLLAVAIAIEAGSLPRPAGLCRVTWISLTSPDTIPDTVLAAKAQSPQLFLLDFSPTRFDEYLDSVNKPGEQIWSARLQSLLAAIANGHHYALLALPKLLLASASLREQLQGSTTMFMAADLFRAAHSHRLAYSTTLCNGRTPPEILHTFLSSNSCSLPHEVIRFLGSRGMHVAEDMTPDELLAFAESLFTSAYYEPAFRLELLCKSRQFSQVNDAACISLDGTLARRSDAPHAIIYTVRDLKTLPQLVGHALLTGEAGCGKTTVLSQIEHYWSFPPTCQGVDLPSATSARRLPLVLSGKQAPTYLPLKIQLTEPPGVRAPEAAVPGGSTIYQQLQSTLRNAASLVNQFRTHRYLRDISQEAVLPWFFSSQLLLLFDGFDTLSGEMQAACRNGLVALLEEWGNTGAVPEPCLVSAQRDLSGTLFPPLETVTIANLSLDQAQEFVAAKLKNKVLDVSALRERLQTLWASAARLLQNPLLLGIYCEQWPADQRDAQTGSYRLLSVHMDQLATKVKHLGPRPALSQDLPTYALNLKFCQTDLAFQPTQLAPRAAEIGVSLGLLSVPVGGQPRFVTELFRDYFAARYLALQFRNLASRPLTEDKHFARILEQLPAFADEWKDMLILLAGQIDAEAPARRHEYIFLVASRAAMVAAACLHELSGPAARTEASGVIAALDAPRNQSPASESIGRGHTSLTLSTARMIGPFDPRLDFGDPGKNLIPVSLEGANGFLVGRYPVTNLEYAEFVRDRGYYNEEFWQPFQFALPEVIRRNEGARVPRYWHHSELAKPNCPVVGISIFEALAYCNWLQKCFPSARHYGLPTEHEWGAVSGLNTLPLFAHVKKLRKLYESDPPGRQRDEQSGPYVLNDSPASRGILAWLRSALLPESGTTDSIALGASSRKSLNVEFDAGPLPEAALASLDDLKVILDPHRAQLSQSGPVPVGVFNPTQTGAFDVLGGVWEWCDEWQELSPVASQPSRECENLWMSAVVKGGVPDPPVDDLWLLLGGAFDPFTQFHKVGFRVCARQVNKTITKRKEEVRYASSS